MASKLSNGIFGLTVCNKSVLQLKVLMVNTKQSGFTLIEIMLVLSITSVLAVTALTGQQALRSRLQFDASVNQLVATINDARNEATAGINNTADLSKGQGLLKCPAGPNANGTVFPYQQYVFAGTMWQVQSAPASPNVALFYYKALTGTGAPVGIGCQFRTKEIVLPRAITVTVPVGAARMVFARDSTGSLRTCVPATANAVPYVSGALPCNPTVLPFTVRDASGHQATVRIDQSGLAQRL